MLLALAACDLDGGPVTPPMDGSGRGDEAREAPGALYLRFVRAVAAADSMEALGPYLEEGVRGGKAVNGKATLVREDRGGWRVRDEAWEK